VDVIVLVLGLAVLWFGTELTIRGAISIAREFGLSEFVVGLAILSVGSDLPELTIAVNGAIQNLRAGQVSGVVIGSALGSALGQIGLVLGIAGLFGSLILPIRTVYRHGSILLGSLVVLGFVAIDATVSRAEGVLLVALYATYLAVLLAERSPPGNKDGEESEPFEFKPWAYLAVGLALVITSAELTVRAVTGVAEAFAIEQSIIAIVVVGLGTSLPELSISLGAVLKKRGHLSVGNLIGSNIFDTLVPIGVAAAISTLHFDTKMLLIDLPFLFALSVVVLVFFVKRRGLQKHESAIVLIMYFGYVVFRLGVS
jgi:cation:H+ antiporter